VKITVIATGFQPRDGVSRPRPAQVQVPVSAALGARAAPARAAEVPPPLPVERKEAAPIRLAQPAAPPPAVHAAVQAAAPARRSPQTFKPLDEDQYDIPAFLRRGGGAGGREE